MADETETKPRVRRPAGSSPRERVRVPAGSSPAAKEKPRVRVPAGSSPRPSPAPAPSPSLRDAMPTPGPRQAMTASGSGGSIPPRGPGTAVTSPGSSAVGPASRAGTALAERPIELGRVPALGRGAGALSRMAGPAGMAASLAIPSGGNNEAADLERLLPRGPDGMRRNAGAVLSPEGESPEATMPPRTVEGRGPGPAARPRPRPMTDGRDNSADSLNRIELARIGRVNRGMEADRPPQFAKGGMVKKGVNPFAKAAKAAKATPAAVPGLPSAAKAPKANPFAAPSKVGKAGRPSAVPKAPMLPFAKGGMAKKPKGKK